MKKIILITFIGIFCFMCKSGYSFDENSFMENECNVPSTYPNCSYTGVSECYTVAGCWKNDKESKCELAGNGYYATNGQLDSCYSPTGATFVLNMRGVPILGMSNRTCPWSIICKKNEFWDKSNNKCIPCNDAYIKNSTPKEGNADQTVYGCGPNKDQTKTMFGEDSREEIFIARCDLQPFTMKMVPDPDNNPDTYFDVTFKYYIGSQSSSITNGGVKYNNQFTTYPVNIIKATTESDKLNWWLKPRNPKGSVYNIYGLVGYTESLTFKTFSINLFSNDDLEISYGDATEWKAGFLAWTLNLERSQSPSFEPNDTLYGIIRNLYYDVAYYNTDGTKYEGAEPIEDIEINTLTVNDKTPSLSITGPSQDGKVFAGWTCAVPDGCTTCTKNCDGTGKLTSVPRPSKNKYDTLHASAQYILGVEFREIPKEDAVPVHIYPYFEPCPVGYYCAGGNQNKCPGGTTSREGASKIEDCFISISTTFKDSKGTIQWIKTGESGVYYK